MSIRTQTIPISKSKLTLLFLASLAFVACGIWFIVAPPKTGNPVFSNPVTLFIVGIAAVLFFGLMGILLLKKLFDTTPGLVISDEGIFDNASAMSAGLIPWTDVVAIMERKIVNQVMINIIVQNPQEYIDKQKSAIRRRLLQSNLDSYGTVISISANGLKVSHAELKVMLDQAFNEFQSSRS